MYFHLSLLDISHYPLHMDRLQYCHISNALDNLDGTGNRMMLMSQCDKSTFYGRNFSPVLFGTGTAPDEAAWRSEST